LIASGIDMLADKSGERSVGAETLDAPDTPAALSLRQKARLAKIVADRPEIVEWLVAGFAAQLIALRFAEARLADETPKARRQQPSDEASTSLPLAEEVDEQSQRRGFLGWLFGPPPPGAARNAETDAGAVPAFEPVVASSRENETSAAKPDPYLQAGFRMAYAIGGGAILSYLLSQSATVIAEAGDGAGDPGPDPADGKVGSVAKHDGTSDEDGNATEPDTDSGIDGEY